jgi:hypothetical protein
LLVGLASLSLLGTHQERTALLSWTLSTDRDVIHVRAVIDTKTEAEQISELIAALYKRLEGDKETTDV